MALRDWASPFHLQAEEDLRAAKAAYASGSPSTFCMLMQMVFEKLGKGAFARRTPAGTGAGAPAQPPLNHCTASHLLEYLKRMPGGGPPVFPRILDAIRELEAAHPQSVRIAVERGMPRYPQLEYPWEVAGGGAIEWPARHLPIAMRVNDPRDRIGAELLKYADVLVKDFDQLFTPHPP